MSKNGRGVNPALATELGGGAIAGAAGWTRGFEWRAALFTEGRIGQILGLALRAFHRNLPQARSALQHTAPTGDVGLTDRCHPFATDGAMFC